MKEFYSVDISALDEQFDKEQKQYYIDTCVWVELRNEHLIGVPSIVKTLDLQTCSLEVLTNSIFFI